MKRHNCSRRDVEEEDLICPEEDAGDATAEKPIRDNAPTYEELYERLTELEDKIKEVAEQIKKSLYIIYGDCNTPQIDIIIEDVIHDIDKLSEE